MVFNFTHVYEIRMFLKSSAYWPTKVVDFGINRKGVCNFHKPYIAIVESLAYIFVIEIFVVGSERRIFSTTECVSAKFILTFKVTEKNYKSAIITFTTLRNDDISSTSSKCRFHKKINARVHFAATVASKFTRFKSGGLQRVEYTAREGVQNTHH